LLAGPGELQELQEFVRDREQRTGPQALEFIASMLKQPAEAGPRRIQTTPWDAATALAVSDALASLRVIKGAHGVPAVLIEQCTATLTELDCDDLTIITRTGRNTSTLTSLADVVLSRCPRLESLTLHRGAGSSSWLALSQLHTLRGVNLLKVPAATIAAALPRLHTLHLDHKEVLVNRAYKDIDRFPVAALFNELLPRLRSFHFDGYWTTARDTTKAADVLPLPLLEDLKWGCWDANLPLRLRVARPSTLAVVNVALDEWLQAVGPSSSSAGATSPLARVRDLTLVVRDERWETASMERLLRAAPQLRRLSFDVSNCSVNPYWIMSVDLSDTLVHDQLRRIAFVQTDFSRPVASFSGNYWCGRELRQRHFRRLRRLTYFCTEFPLN
jgi:hypothetical protein